MKKAPKQSEHSSTKSVGKRSSQGATLVEYALILILFVGALFWFRNFYLYSVQNNYDAKKGNLNMRQQNYVFQ